MRYFGRLVFGFFTLAVTAGVYLLANRMALAGKGGGLMALRISDHPRTHGQGHRSAECNRS